MNIITIGNRCTTDQFLEKNNSRLFSGPFSYLIVDFKTALHCIKTNFKYYFKDLEKIDNSNFKIKYLPHWRMSKVFYINNYYTNKNDIINETKCIYDIESILSWNHYNILDKENQIIFERRIKRIMEKLNNTNCLLFYIDKILDKPLTSKIEDIKLIVKEEYLLKHKILYIIPFDEKYENELKDFNCKLYYEDENLIIYLLKVSSIDKLEIQSKKQNKSGRPLLNSDYQDKDIKWDKLMNNIKNLLNP